MERQERDATGGMLDDEARRALEEEAIALVSLSNPTTRFLDRPVERTTTHGNRTSGESKALCYTQHQQQPQRHHQQQGTNGGAIHPMLQVKANLIARRDGKLAGAPARKLRIKAGGDNPAAASNDEQGEKNAAFLSMEVYVNGEGSSAEGDLKLAPHSNRNNTSSSHPTKRAMSHAGGEELYAQNPAVSEEQQQLDALNGNISMKSLLVTLKKRKLSPHADAEAAAAAESAKVLPSFRDVFESPHQASLSQSQTSSSGVANASPSTTSATPNAVLSSAELKCKYRTGKCSNVRALKSCGDYHNLCNYHRLRANANQRKLDRKKKVQRQQTTPGSAVSSPQAAGTATEGSVAAMLSSSSPASVSAAAALCNPSAAAAAALVSMPTSAPPPAMLFHHHQQQQRYEDAAMPHFAPQASAPVGSGRLDQQSSSSSSNSLRVKQEDRCM